LWWTLSLNPTLHYDNHDHQWSTMVQCRIVAKIVSIWKWTMVNHGPTSHCNKHYLNIKINHGQVSNCNKDCVGMKINHGQRSSSITLWQRFCWDVNQPWSTMFILGFIIFIIGFIYLELMILNLSIWYYSFLSLVLIPCVY